MATLYDLKPRFQAQLRPLTRWLARQGVTANQVTLAAALASLALGAALAIDTVPRLFLLLPVFLFVRMALNAIDGMLAREHGQQSRLGAILNEITDVVSDAALYLPFALIPGVSAGLVVIVVLLAALTEMTGVIGYAIGASRRYDGPMGKSDRAFLFGLLGLLFGIGLPIGGVLMNSLLTVVAVLLVLTIVRRAQGALGESA
ncbi:CDP-diacylglycerol/glycerol-3-phosphate 3-phosphatidyltransferase [Methylocaldum marinum]|uniref:CDP-diacylglycerol/glycerol-3-phosphate 3-phosphatidyltransferase n=1 Tax=Methylocaldum marinum TaxID=1432792 RepID=A0A250KN75_9GAMM|nr:CDP-alcohol phosphatidyltransferase family protein [Methylocaldum marinum]BBA33037.1 CDP-diacylglycerol/glycerol-3-phosphate 3-phosphatidyltransferase [Methylocaldum marinum]